MPDRKFPILGTHVPSMLGRESIMQRMLAGLTKPTPDHLQVVGARFAGKTVLLNELARSLATAGKPYTAILVWDLGHQTPATDELFMLRLASELAVALRTNHAAYAEHLESTGGARYKEIGEVLDALKADGGKVLAIMDGFDKPLANGQLTRNLWDQLRELALKPSLRLVTASRRTLRELIRHPDAQTSDFWNIFDPIPVRVGCFDEADLNALLADMPGIELTVGAKSELWNASNGFPVIMLEVLNTLVEMGVTGSVDPATMRSACDSAYLSVRDKLESLWADCPPSCQDLLRRVREHSPVTRDRIPNVDAESLIERGFVRLAANRLQGANRLLGRFLDEQPNEGSALARLFARVEDYQRHFKGVLERRITQITGMDATLRRFLQRAIEDLPEHPAVFLTNVRGIVDQAFELIWKAELKTKAIPSGWMAIWKRNDERGLGDWETTFPHGVHRVRLLNLMTGTDRSTSCAKHVSKSTYVLINAVHAFGDFGQHQDGAPVDPGTAYAALHLCVELAAALTRELS